MKFEENVEVMTQNLEFSQSWAKCVLRLELIWTCIDVLSLQVGTEAQQSQPALFLTAKQGEDLELWAGPAGLSVQRPPTNSPAESQQDSYTHTHTHKTHPWAQAFVPFGGNWVASQPPAGRVWIRNQLRSMSSQIYVMGQDTLHHTVSQ